MSPSKGHKFKQFRSFEEARTYVRTLRLKTVRQWEALRHQRPPDIPSNPQVTYRDQWQGWDDFLGTGFLPFEEAREFARSLGLTSGQAWSRWVAEHRPAQIPVTPRIAYKERWRGWADWLGDSYRGRKGIPARRSPSV